MNLKMSELGAFVLHCSVCGSQLAMGEYRAAYCPACEPAPNPEFQLRHDDDCSAVLAVLWHPRGFGTYCPTCRFTPDTQSVTLVQRQP